MVGNLVLWRRVSVAINCDFQTFILWYTSLNENFEYAYPHSNEDVSVFLQKDSERLVCCAYVQMLPAA